MVLMSIGIYVVDDHALVRRGLVNVINLEDGLRVVGDGGDTAKTLASSACAPRFWSSISKCRPFAAPI
jgi:DNA-binding NarL/FixJ family response regulator